ncbi:MAG TPA: DegT/DnrJ/EryC1/StrS family aminotransferase [Candidatus Nanoarchaeia archaeon]|nr:DegT/DnrJ/EryC1/StrS family aminotransferase [Candidatus Nanoarchaeia archaeon]
MENESKLKQLSGKKHIILTPSGDHAIKAVFSILKGKKCLIPDQAGWLSYRKLPLKLGYEVEEVKTDFGIIDLEDLKKKAKNSDCFIYQQPAGYFAEQDTEAIYEICKEKCIVIMDIAGSIGSRLYNPKFCDIAVCSFGKWKPIDVGYGGCLAFDDDMLNESAKEFEEFDDKYAEKLAEQISLLNNKYKKYSEITKKIKKDLSTYEIIHPTLSGISVVVKFTSQGEKEKLINYCRGNGLEFTLCPRYIRVLDNAISIEVKRLKVM